MPERGTIWSTHQLGRVIYSGSSDDLLEINRRVQALSELLETDTGQSLLAGYKRGANILAAEEKKDGTTFTGDIDTSALTMEEELTLARAIAGANSATTTALEANDYRAAVGALAELRAPVDAFFDKVLVNDPDPAIRANRLNLLARLRDTMHLVADFSKIAG